MKIAACPSGSAGRNLSFGGMAERRRKRRQRIDEFLRNALHYGAQRRHRQDRKTSHAADKGIDAAHPKHVPYIRHGMPARCDGQGRSGDEHDGQSIVASHGHLDDELEKHERQDEPQPLRMHCENDPSQDQTDQGAVHPFDAAWHPQ
ncbi:hypothetical protein GCM10027278_30780 [Paralcaligenes ginsengisoli]